jgi:vacuolar-type H+-ATPase subunit I/STV1
MRGILCVSDVKTNEEYREVIKNRMKIMIVLIILGIITAAIGFSAEFYFDVPVNDQMIGVYSGVGVGLFIVGTILLIKNKMLLKDEKKLKESRLNNTDERINEISNKAFKIASYAMIITLYLIALIGGLFYPILAEVLLFIVCVFLLFYMGAFKYYNNRM